MTRPIYEPTTQRSVRKLGWSADQLFRRPSPAQEDAGGGQWCRVWLDHNQTVAQNQREVVEFDIVNNPYPTYFDTTAAAFGFPNSGITILQDGVYAFTFRLEMDTLPDVPFATSMNGIDWSEFLYYEKTWDPTAVTGFSLNDSYTYRSGPDYGDEPPVMYVILDCPNASTVDAIIEGGEPEGSYMEIIRISGAACVGNPFDPCAS